MRNFKKKLLGYAIWHRQVNNERETATSAIVTYLHNEFLNWRNKITTMEQRFEKQGSQDINSY